jgi:hypothetical protein
MHQALVTLLSILVDDPISSFLNYQLKLHHDIHSCP